MITSAGVLSAQVEPSASVVDLGDRLVVELGGQAVTEYHYRGFRKPILWPVIGPTGVAVNRQWPMAGAADETRDHVHHRSLWFAHGAVNGHDFWSEGPGSGTIEHVGFDLLEAGRGVVTVTARNRWRAADGAVVCTDVRRLRFWRSRNALVIDFDITLLASHGKLHFGDTKEGTMAIRLAPSLRLTGAVAAGHARNSEGVRDGELWGKRAAWVDYWGPLDGDTVGVAIFDHPDNHGYPTWWHARDYGLVAANPFGVHDFEGGRAGAGDLDLPAGGKLPLRYRFYIHRGDADRAAIADRYGEYTGRRDRRGAVRYSEEFAGPESLRRWAFSDPEAWRWRDGSLELFGEPRYQPPVRSPRQIAVLGDIEVSAFTLDLRVRQTGREYGHRDLCVFFGFVDPTHYYYAHLASVADDHAHNVFLVNGAARTAIAARTTSGVGWGEDRWHDVRVTRDPASGHIAVYFDDFETPIMEATDKTFDWGRIGIGSFDDSGRVDRLELRAPVVRKVAPPRFQ